MKRSLAVFLLAAASCTGGKTAALDAGAVDAGPLVLEEREPNDGPGQALALTASATVNANLGADPGKTDEDWYVIKSQLPKTADVKVTAPPGADVILEVMDEARSTLASLNSGGVGASERFVDLDVSGKVFFRVVGAKRGTGGAYTVSVTLKDRVGGFELEPNDRRVDATPVQMGQAVSGYIGHVGDEDWYRYELPNAGPNTEPVVDAGGPDGAAADAGEADAATEAAGAAGLTPAAVVDAGPAREAPKLALRVDVSGVEGVRFDLAVMTEAEAVLFSAKSGDGAGLSLRNIGVRATDRVIYVVLKSAPIGSGKDAKRGYNVDTYYTLTVVPEEAGSSAEYEPNDDASKATDLPRDGYREGFISPSGDVDYYRLTTGGPSLVRVAVTGVEKLDLVLSLVKPGDKEEVLLKANDGAVKEGEMLDHVSCNPDCVFRVEAGPRKVDGKLVKDDENGEMAYRITATVSPDDGVEEREPNNTPETATTLELGKSMRGTVFPKKDVDYLKLDLSARPVKTAIKATLLGILKVHVGLYLHRYEGDKLELVQTSDHAKGDAPEVIRAALEPGVYMFEVRDVKNREANFQDSWQLTVEESED